MKKILFVLVMVLMSVCSFGQDLKTECEKIKNDIKELPYQYTINGTSLEIQHIFELDSNLNKETIYNIVKNYVISSYGNANSVIQTDNKSGGRVVVKGLFADVYCNCGNIVFGGSAMEYTATHIIQFDIKDGRMRVTMDITSVKQKSGGNKYMPLTYIDFVPTQFYPFKTACDVYSGNHQFGWYPSENSPRQQKGCIHEGMVMYNILLRANGTMESIYDACTNSNTTQRASDDW
jgi:hypothetical protein